MTPDEITRRMLEIEQHEQDWDGLEFLAWLVEQPPGEEFEQLVGRETRRAVLLAEGYYQRMTQRVAVLNPQMIAQIGFIQGATFAAAALGKEPFEGTE
jgi:hypothetical protein